MKRFGEYISNQDEKVAPSIEKTVEKKSIDEAASLGDLLIGLAAAGGAAGFKAAWNKWAPTKGARAKRKEKADDKEERRQEKIAKAKKKGNEKKLKKLMSPDEYKKYGDEKTQKKKDDQKAKLDKKGEKKEVELKILKMLKHISKNMVRRQEDGETPLQMVKLQS